MSRPVKRTRIFPDKNAASSIMFRSFVDAKGDTAFMV